MSDTTMPDAAEAASGSALSLPEAVQILAARRAARAGADQDQPDDAEAADGAAADEDNAAPTAPAPEPGAGQAEGTAPSTEGKTDTADGAETTLEVDGVRLTADEVRRGYMRQADYSRKTQDLADTNRALAAEREVKLARLDELIAMLEAQQLQEPDWVDMARADPLGWVQRKINWDNHRTALESAKRISEAVRADALTRDKRLMAADLARRYNTAWQDPRVMERDFRAIAQYAAAQGFTAAEIDAVAQARHLIVLDKARRWDELTSQAPFAVKRMAAKPQVQRPGAKPSAAAHQRSLNAAWERFVKNPTIETGAAYQRAKHEAGLRRAGG